MVTPSFGDAAEQDLGVMEFYADNTGTIDLASAGANDNYATCEQCVRFFVDPAAEDANGNPTPGPQFFQSAGTITIDAATPPSGGVMQVSLAGVKLVEVTIGDGTFLSTPVPNGACIDIADGSLTAQ